MPKAAKKRTQAKSLSQKKKLSSADMKKVKGGHNYVLSAHNYESTLGAASVILTAAQKVKK